MRAHALRSHQLDKKVYLTQKSLRIKNDWVQQLEKDLESCEIALSEDEIKTMKKEQFKTFVNKKVKTLARKYLIDLRSEHSKSKNLLHENCMKEYLRSEKITLEEKQLLFSMKTRTVNVKTNFKSKFSNLSCRLCGNPSEEESEIHLLRCEKLIFEQDFKTLLDKIIYTDIFGKIEKQVNAIKIWKKLFKVWNYKIENVQLSSTGHQAHLPQGQSDSNSSFESGDNPYAAYDSTVYDWMIIYILRSQDCSHPS